MTGFNYDILNQSWEVGEFGQPQNPQKAATEVDRYGRQQPYTGALAECAERGQAQNCKIDHAFETLGANEPGAFSIYLWIPGQAPPTY